ncbi:TPA: hypothetical protein DDW35_08995 [Candidatus Sumerlaeota bacterium]|nr:hypothetical protein [Candidatus Sumerlaeota bacterium]
MVHIEGRTLAKEWLFFLGMLVLSAVVMPGIIAFLFHGTLAPWGTFYPVLFGLQNGEFFAAWLIVIAPYLLVQFIRITCWAIMHV